jgi:chromosome partitioning protein
VNATAKVIAFANQKGGVAKTTTTLNLAVAFAEEGHRVLCCDVDPQGNLTMSQGVDPDTLDKSMYDVLVHRISVREVIRKREVDVACASIDLAGAEIAMSTMIGRERSLQKALKEVQDDYDFVFIDTPPSLGLLTLNALVAADAVLIPMQCEYYALEGLGQLVATIEMVKSRLNPRLEIEGILLCMYDPRQNLTGQVDAEVRGHFDGAVFDTVIPRNVRLSESPSFGQPILLYDVSSRGAQSYLALAKEYLKRRAKSEPR